DLLRKELHFRGVAVSDWEDIIRLNTVHHVAPTQKDAVRMAVMAGIGMSMVPENVSFYDDLLALVHEGAIPVSRIDESVRRILKLKYELGLFKNAAPDTAMLKQVGSEASLAVSRQAAEEAVTLLKKDGARAGHWSRRHIACRSVRVVDVHVAGNGHRHVPEKCAYVAGCDPRAGAQRDVCAGHGRRGRGAPCRCRDCVLSRVAGGREAGRHR